MTEALLAGIRILDLAGEPAAMAGRILAALGAEVILVEPRAGHPLRALPRRFLAWGAGKASVAVDGPGDPQLDELLATADAVHRAVRVRARGRRDRVRRAHRAGFGLPASHRRLDARGRVRRQHGRGRLVPEDGSSGSATRRQHRPDPGDLA